MVQLDATSVRAGYTLRKHQSLESEAPPIGNRLLTLREAADVLHLSSRTVREYVQRGEIKGKIIGNRWRFRREDIDAFFEAAPAKWDFVRKNNHGE